jgi:hypothetical protein
LRTACPGCGADVEFRYDDTFVRVCEHCRAAVVRTDRGIETLGRVADLLPHESPFRLFAEGQFEGQRFLLVGMAQLRHIAGGVTQEWYAKFDGGAWGWLAEAQGRYYLTFEVPGAEVPDWSGLAPGRMCTLPTPAGPSAFTVAEIAGATYLAAHGEIPFRLVPQGGYRFVDLADASGWFATIDYGQDGDPPTLYVGRQVALAELAIQGGEALPAAAPRTITSSRLSCPNCNAAIELQVPDQSQRVVCAYCHHLASVEHGALRVLRKLTRKAAPVIPLGTSGTLAEGPMTVIGYLGRSAQVDGTWYPFEEYLLYAPQIGFRWLVLSDGHWSYVQPVAVGAVDTSKGRTVYDGVRFQLYQQARLRVDAILGELYWQVEVGEEVQATDYVAPPAMLSRETAPGEQHWSLATYLTPAQVKAAFQLATAPVHVRPSFPPRKGVAPNQPVRAVAAAGWMTLGLAVLLAVGAGFAATATERIRIVHAGRIFAGAPPTAPSGIDDEPPVSPNIVFSEPFRLEAGQNVALEFDAQVDNNWAFVVASLVELATGAVTTVDATLEYYAGVSGGESWSEGKRQVIKAIAPVPAGEYALRFDAQQGGAGSVSYSVTVRQDVFRGIYLAIAILLLGIPAVLLGLLGFSREHKRWDNSSLGAEHAPRRGLVIALLAGLVTAGGAIFVIWA